MIFTILIPLFHCSSNKTIDLDDIVENKIGEPVSSSKSKRMIIDDKLFIHRPTGIEKSKTPVCDFVYRDKAGAKFYTALSQKQREILWEFLGRDHSRFDF